MDHNQGFPEVSDTVEHLFSCKNHNNVIDLSIGAPGPEILCKLPDMFQKATEKRMKQEQDFGNLFQYGPEQGIVSFRKNLADFLESEYESAVDIEELILTTGATNGLFLACSILLDTNAVVYVENPTYFIALKLLAGDLGFRIKPIPMDKDGIDWRELERTIQKNAKENENVKTRPGRYQSLLYIIPNYHNPTGVTYSIETCKGVLKVARDNNLLVICDDVYNLLSYNTKPVFSRLKALDKDGVVISNGTFSKFLAPGVRLGWLEVPKALVSRFIKCGVLLSGGSQNNYTSGIVCSMLQDGVIKSNLEFIRKLYGVRMNSAIEYLRENLPSGWTCFNPGGGYFLWLSADHDLVNFSDSLETAGVTVLFGERACPYSYLEEDCEQNWKNCIRLSIAYYPTEKILEACRIICNVAVNNK